MKAAASGQPDIVDILLSKKADPNLLNDVSKGASMFSFNSRSLLLAHWLMLFPSTDNLH